MIGRFIDKFAGVKQAIQDKWLFVTNYASFKATKAHRQTLASKAERREMARKVAFFIDLRNGLGAQARLMRQDLKSGEKFYQHHDYSTWFEKTLLKNRFAYEIKQQYHLFEKALTLNRIYHDTLDKMALDHKRAIQVKSYLHQHQKGQTRHRCRLASMIESELANHYSHIVYQAKNADLSHKAIVHHIRLDATAYQSLNQCLANELERLAALKSPIIEWIITAKSRLDKATKKMDRDVYQRSYEQAIKSLFGQEKLFLNVNAIAPGLARSFSKTNQPLLEVNVDWLSDQFNSEFKALEKSNDKQHQQLAKLQVWLHPDKGTPKKKLVANQLEAIAMKIARYPSNAKSLKKLAPNLTEKILKFAKFKVKQRDIGRDL